ncbi:hypothetical protein [Micromonospora carbonacea]|uniref:Uncharacterized protein n=1 Tax=Micromonospora carbonacea TaxID=47853 RepID=A0A1C5A2T7_9ACTN|nr:hypothetical protein [Micromonospora carbonacea]SCF39525.1 hypothetical protein GA0070563_11132 [Micromonospora carbonacea]
MSIKDRIRRAKAAPGGTVTKPIKVWLAPNMGLVERYQQAVADLESAESADSPPPGDSLEGGSSVVELRARVDQLRAELDEYALELTVRALSDDEWQRLVDDHPPRRKTETSEGDPRDAEYGWNTTTFPGALLRAGTVAPDLDDEDWAMLLGSDGQPGVLTHPQVQEAAGAVAGLTRFRLDIPFS